mgnify:CR=1 FL=1
MSKFNELIEKYLLPIAGKLSASRVLTVLRDSFMLSFPLTIVGSLAVVIMNLPYLDKVIGSNGVATVTDVLSILPSATMSIATLFVVMGIGYYLAKSYDVDPIFPAAISVASFLVLTLSIVCNVLQSNHINPLLSTIPFPTAFDIPFIVLLLSSSAFLGISYLGRLYLK